MQTSGENTSQPGAPEKIYEWDVAQIGDASPPFAYVVSAENIADYCRAVQYENPIYTSDGAAREAG
ncbi:MAG: MaoC family dehydratase N-terminal domain-containing protein, partial [Dehalococcoidia bacterium]|nr:MaoC family dehydratase N-terminal domain-containing protein [Dehalococcoidia bacterium]